MVLHESDRVVVLEPTHDLFEGGECDRMEEQLTRLASDGASIVVDLSHVQHVTARCLGILAHAMHVATHSGGFIVVCGVTPMQRWLLHKTGLDEVIPIATDLDSAKRYLASARASVA